MTEIIVMSAFCVLALFYGYAVVFKKTWLARLGIAQDKEKNNEQTITVGGFRRIVGVLALLLGTAGLIVNLAMVYVLIRGGAV